MGSHSCTFWVVIGTSSLLLSFFFFFSLCGVRILISSIYYYDL